MCASAAEAGPVYNHFVRAEALPLNRSFCSLSSPYPSETRVFRSLSMPILLGKNLEIFALQVYSLPAGFFAPFPLPNVRFRAYDFGGEDYQRSAARGIRILSNHSGPTRAQIHPSQVP